MPINVASHLYRNRHGTFYFRLIVPKRFGAEAKKVEHRFSLQTEERQKAVVFAMRLICALPQLSAPIEY